MICKACEGSKKSSLGTECHPCRGTGWHSGKFTWTHEASGLPIVCDVVGMDPDYAKSTHQQLLMTMCISGRHRESSQATNRQRALDIIAQYMTNVAGELAAWGNWALEVGEETLFQEPSPLPQYQNLDEALVAITEAAEAVAAQVQALGRDIRRREAEEKKNGISTLPSTRPGVPVAGGGESSSSPLSGLLS